MTPYTIAIAGGGFSGAMLAVQLARQARRPVHVRLFDPSGRFGLGAAYGTRDPGHLLNVPAGKMSAFADQPDHFYQWLEAESSWRGLDSSFASFAVSRDRFMPRMIYGAYVVSLLDEAGTANPNVTIDRVADAVSDAEPQGAGLRLSRQSGAAEYADRLVLALGNLPARAHHFARNLSSRYVANLWGADGQAAPAGDGPVLIIGTGLTTIDAMLSLRRQGFSGTIIALSRHGLLPQPHAPATQAAPALSSANPPKTARELVRAIRRAVRLDPENWRGVIDALRGDTPALWHALPVEERQKLLRLLTFWGVHRHRMPPESAAWLAGEQQAGRLVIRSGRIASVTETPGSLSVRLNSGEILEVSRIINCAGPQPDIARAGHPLLDRLMERHLVTPHKLALGLERAEGYRVQGPASDRLSAIGPLLLGEWLETTAVPELRAQTQQLAAELLA